MKYARYPIPVCAMTCKCGVSATYVSPDGEPTCREHYEPEAPVARPMSWHEAQGE